MVSSQLMQKNVNLLPKMPNIIRSSGNTNLIGAQSTYSWKIPDMMIVGRDAMRLYQPL